VLDSAFAVTTTSPDSGTTSDTLHVIAAPAASALGVGLGRHAIVAPPGNVTTAHCGFAAGLGPALVQVAVAEIVAPATAEAGRPVTVACMSALGVGLAT
jgi:hypothetical protein